MAEFWKLLRESTIIQAMLALMFGAALVYMFVTGRPIPELLSTLSALVFGFYFGAKSTASAKGMVEEALKGR